MEPDALSLRAGAAAVYAELRPEYLAQLVAPLDDMWATFSDMAAPHALLVGEEVVGCCAVDEEGPGLGDITPGTLEDHQRIVDFEIAALGAPRAFLEVYVGTRLEREELLLYERGGAIVCVGELRRDVQQAGVAQVGLVVAAPERSKGIGSRMLASLVAQSLAEGLTPYCSTEVSNPAARRAIERAGFRATHRLLRVAFRLEPPPP